MNFLCQRAWSWSLDEVFYMFGGVLGPISAENFQVKIPLTLYKGFLLIKQMGTLDNMKKS